MVRFHTQLTPTPVVPTPRFWPTGLVVRDLLLEENTYRAASIPEDVGDAVSLAPDRSGDEAAPIPDPTDDVDALEELEEEITTLAAHIHAATHRLLILIAAFDRRRGWELGGHLTCAHWLSFRTGIDLGTAREKVRTARVLLDLPLTSASMARGELSFSKVRALSRVATADNEEELLPFARSCTTAHLERMVRGFKRGSRKDEAALERERHASRSLSVFPDDEGMYVIRGRFPAEVGALLMRAVEAASDALYREKREPRLEKDAEREKAAAQRRADALGLLAERALAVGFGGRGEEEGGADAGCSGDDGADDTSGVASGVASGVEGTTRASCGCDADCHHPIPISGSRAGRYQVVLHVEAETLKAEGEPGRSELEDGTRVSAETSGRLSCDASLVRVRHAPDGSILDVGRRTRTIPPALRRALDVRDQGCRFPGCGLRFAEGHHVKHWADGGETSLGNTLLLCRHHHRLVHEGGWTVDWWGRGRPVFFDPRGGTHFDGRWQAPRRSPLDGRAGETSASGLENHSGEGPASGPRKCSGRASGSRPGKRSDGASGSIPGKRSDGVSGSRPGKRPAHVSERAPGQCPAQGRGENPKGRAGEELVAALTEENRHRGVKPHGWTASTRWKREADIPDGIYFRALEALEEGGP